MTAIEQARLALVLDQPSERDDERQRDRTRIAQVSRMFVNPFGFSNGCAEFVL